MRGPADCGRCTSCLFQHFPSQPSLHERLVRAGCGRLDVAVRALWQGGATGSSDLAGMLGGNERVPAAFRKTGSKVRAAGRLADPPCRGRLPLCAWSGSLMRRKSARRCLRIQPRRAGGRKEGGRRRNGKGRRRCWPLAPGRRPHDGIDAGIRPAGVRLAPKSQRLRHPHRLLARALALARSLSQSLLPHPLPPLHLVARAHVSVCVVAALREPQRGRGGGGASGTRRPGRALGRRAAQRGQRRRRRPQDKLPREHGGRVRRAQRARADCVPPAAGVPPPVCHGGGTVRRAVKPRDHWPVNSTGLSPAPCSRRLFCHSSAEAAARAPPP